ncbi:hypothetical protein [Actinocorallia longicatena]|uniref:Guanylate cyclase domain-containing protein n=1 Tax=Actinocorallia longicatena TaxID=111803 RepID=A0ABP6Q1E0_9ACTN
MPHRHRPHPSPQTVRPFLPAGSADGPAHGLRPRIHTTMLAVDICAFGDPRRDDTAQLRLRQEMYDRLRDACGHARLPWQDCHREDRGDGALVIAPPETPTERLLDPLARNLADALRDYNRRAPDHMRLQLRLAAHSGLINRDAYGVTGQALVHLFRLLDARAFKKAVKDSGASFGMIISERFYGDALSHGGLPAPADYQPISVKTKETRTRAHLHIPAG